MALKKTVLLPVGTNLNFKYPDFNICSKETEELLNDAYIRIDEINGSKDNLSLRVGVYDKPDGILIIHEYFNFNPSVEENSSNFIKQGYDYLKNTEKYRGAFDC